MNSSTKKISKYSFLAATFLPFIISLIGLALGGFAPFGTKDVLTAGGYENIIPYFHELYDRAHNGTALSYSTNTGLGYDFTTVITYYLSDPVNFLVLFFPKSQMLGILNILYSVKLGFAGLSFFIFLSYRDKVSVPSNKNISSCYNNIYIMLAFSTAYALSSHMISYGLDITHLSAFAIFPLVIMGIDKIVYEHKWHNYLIAFTLSIFFNFYISIITFIFSIIYLLTYDYKNTIHVINTIARKFFADLLSIGISSIIIINNINSLFIKDDLSLKFYSRGLFSNVWNIIKMTLSHSLPFQIALDSYGVNINSGIICILLIIPFLVQKELKPSYRARHLLLLVLLLLACCTITGNYFFNGFYLSISYRAFFGYIICFLLLSMAYTAISYIENIKSSIIITSFIASVIIIILTMLFCTAYDSSSPFITSLEFLLFYMLILLMYKQSSVPGKIVNIVLSVVIMAEVVSGALTSLKQLGSVAAAYEETDSYTIEMVLNDIHNLKPSARVYVYNDTESTDTPLTFLLNGYDYVIYKNDEEIQPDSYLELFGSYSDYNIYFNPYSLSNGIFVTENPDNFDYDYQNPYTSSNLFVKNILNVDELFTQVNGTERNVSMPNDNNDFDYYLQFTIDSSGDFYGNLSSKTIHSIGIKAGEPFLIPYKTSKLLLRVSDIGGEMVILNDNTLKNIHSMYSEANVSFDTRNIYIESSRENGFYILPIAESSKWIPSDSSVDLKVINPDGSNLVLIKGTTDDISLSFRPKFFILGIIISILSLTLSILISLLILPKMKSSIELTKFSLFCDKHKDYIILFIFSTVIFILLLMYTCSLPFGNRTAIISDGYVQYFPVVTNLFNKLRSFDFLSLNYQMGYGMDNFVMSLGSILTPTNWVIALFPNTYSIVVFTLSYYLSFILIAPSMYLYLTKSRFTRAVRDNKLLLFTAVIAYSLSTYVICYFTFFLKVVYMLPVLLLAMEHLIYNKKPVPYIIILSYIMITQPYEAFLDCEFLALYFFIIEFDDIKDFLCKGVRFALSSITSALISAFELIPFYIFTTNSPYKDSDTAPPSISFDNTLIKSLYDTQFLHIPTPVTSDNSRANIYCGVAILLSLSLYLVNKKIKLSRRIRTVILLCFFYFAFGNPFWNYVLHGFHMQSMVPGRFAIFFIIILITCFVETILNFDGVKYKKAIIAPSIMAIILIMGILILNKDYYDLSSISTIALLAIYLAIIIIMIIKPYELINKIFLYTIITELILNAYLVSPMSIGQGITINENTINTLRSLSRDYNLNESRLIRTEIPNFMVRNASNLINTNSISYFSSMTTKYQTELSKSFNTQSGFNFIQYSQGNPLSNMMLSVKYFATSSYNDYIEMPSYLKVQEIRGSITMYDNEYSINPGILMPSEFLTLDYADYNNPFEYQNTISNKVTNDKLYELLDYQLTTEANNLNPSVYISINEELSNDDRITLDISVKTDKKEFIYLSLDNTIYYLGETNGNNNQADFQFELLADLNPFENEDYNLYIAKLNTSSLEKLKTELDKNTMTEMAYGFNTIEGSINADKSGVIFLSVPAYPKWEAYVDGNKVNCGNYLGGLGIPVDSGAHRIKIVYHTDGLKLGSIISLIALMIFIIYIINTNKSKASIKESDFDTKISVNIDSESNEANE